jgi:hypothetical protein
MFVDAFSGQQSEKFERKKVSDSLSYEQLLSI